MEKNLNAADDFALSEGGPIYNSLIKQPLFNSQGKLALLGVCIAWLPLVIITAIEGTLISGVQMPFFYDVAMQARLLIALPMLIFIKIVIDNKVMEVAKYIGNALMSPDERQFIISTAFRRAKNLSSSAVTEITLLLIVIVTTVSMVNGEVYSALKTDTTSWMASIEEGSQVLTVAGYWAVCISIPFFQFFLLRWLWRYLVWVLLLFRLSKANLNLLPTHADKSGGLGIILLAQRSFNMFFVANSVVLSGQLIAQLLTHPDAFFSFRNIIIGYIILCLLLLLFPLVFFTGKLFKTKNEGLLRMSNLGADLSRKFEKEWVNEKPIEKIIENTQVDPSMVYDYSGMYDSLQQLRVVPVTLRDVVGMGLVLFVPFTPIFFIHFSVAEMVQKIAGMLI